MAQSIAMDRLLYEKSISHRGYLVIPFVVGTVLQQTMYSYTLLSELGHRGRFHRQDNPNGICDPSLDGILAIAKEFLDAHSDCRGTSDYFKHRYTYHNNLIILFEEAGKWFYDHYPPRQLRNIAAPKIFTTQEQCLQWIKQGLDRFHVNPEVKTE